MDYSVRSIKTTNVDEAAFYIMYGAILSKVRTLPLPVNRAKKKGYPLMWTVYVNNVPLWALESWRTEHVYGNISLFTLTRKKLKKRIKEYIRST